MKLPSVAPLEENYLCRDKEDFANLVWRTIKESRGAFFKVLGKVDDEPYYATLLIDDQKILAVEVQDVKGGSTLIGKPALELLKDILEVGPVIVDVFLMNDIDVKMSVMENIDVYKSTPKMSLDEMCPTIGSIMKTTEIKSTGQVEQKSLPVEEKTWKASSSEVKPEGKLKIREKPKPRTEFDLNVPSNLEPYLRAFSNKIVRYAKSIGVEVSKIKIDTKEVRYALGAGSGLHTTIEIEGSSNSLLSAERIKQNIENFIYQEAGELSKELGKRVVVSHFSLKI
ncbi:DUF2226 domain-containing protein [Thermococcus sp.]